MSARSTNISVPPSRLNIDFWKFWAGQTISNLGSSFTLFALPLLIFKLTGSALNLGFATMVNLLPYLLFGLLIGAWVDRVNRKQLMIITDVVRMLIIASIPLLAAVNLLSIWWIYAVAFISSTLSIGFNAAQFAAIPSLVNRDDLVTANGRIQASYSAASVIGPLLAGLLLAVIPLTSILLFDAATFLISAASLALIKTSFNARTNEEQEQTSIRRDIVEGLRYVLSHPVLRSISLMMALVNLVSTTVTTQLVLFAKSQLSASDTQVGLLYAAGSAGVVVLSLAAGFLRKRWSFSTVALGALMLNGLLTVILALMHWYWAALSLWALISGLFILFNINTSSLRQAIVPDHLLGRVMTIAAVVAWSPIPLGALIGGLIIEQIRNVALVYGVIGVLIFLIPLTFSFTALGHAERYLPQAETSSASN
jgi:MFS family permease